MEKWRLVGRAAVALVLVVGFYVLVLGYALGLPFGVSWLAFEVSSGNVLVLVVAGLGIGLVVGSLVGSMTALRSEPVVAKGIPLYRQDAPVLWQVIDEVGGRVGTRVPDQVWLTGDVGVSVVERARLLGLLAGARTLFVGLPVLLTLSVGEVRAILTHEFGHYAYQHNRLRAVSYRTHVAVARVVGRFAKRKLNPLSWLFRGYAVVFLLVQRAVSRQQELEADRMMGQLAGRVRAQSALRAVGMLDAAWQVYYWAYVHSGLHHGMAPADVFGGFRRLLDARRDQLEVEFGTPVAVPSRWDTHPMMAERLWALESAPEVPAIAADEGNAAAELIPDVDAVGDRLAAVWFEFDSARRLPWEDYEREAWLAELRWLAGATYRAIARATDEATLDAVLRACAAGEGEDWLWRLNLPEGGLTAAILLAGHEAGSVHFEQRWDVPSRVVDRHGDHVDLDPILVDIAAGTIDGAQRARAALTGLGVDVTTPYNGPAQLPPGEAAIIGAIAHVKLDGQIFHLLIADLGLLFVPCTDTSDNGKQTLLRLAGERSGKLAARPGAVWLPYEEIVHATIHRDVPIKATLRLYTGAEPTIAAKYTGYVHGKSHDTISTMLKSIDG